MKIKICGITTPGDAEMAARAGADAVGLNFVGGPRRISLDQAEAILKVLPPLVVPVALVQLEDGLLNEQVAELLATRWVSTIQVYGEASAEALDRLAWEGYRTLLPVTVQDAGFAANPPDALRKAAGTSVAAVVLDAHEPGKLGGTGKTFGWPWVQQARTRGELDRWPPILLAGGLTPDNVVQAVVEARPYGVDVSSGVESSPGRKDPDKVRRFIMEARRAAETI